MDIEDFPSTQEFVDKKTDTSAKNVNGKKKKSGGFQSMGMFDQVISLSDHGYCYSKLFFLYILGLSQPVLKGILTKGYKVPTPIQRKVIPIISQGVDVVAMARTGSGKRILMITCSV